MFRKKTAFWLIAVVVVIGVIVGPALVSARTPNTSILEDTATITSIEVTDTIDTSGYVNARPFVSLKWKTSGTVESSSVKVGDFVKSGDVLMTLQTTSAPANIILARADLVNYQEQLERLQKPDGEAIAAAQKKLATSFSDWNSAREELNNELARKSTSGDSKKYDALTSANTELSDALDAFVLTASLDSQWYYWAVSMLSLGRSDDYDFAALAASLGEEVDSDNADLINDIVETQKSFEEAVDEFAESITDYAASIFVNDASAAYHQVTEKLLVELQAGYEALENPNSNAVIQAQAKLDSAKASVDSLSIIAPFDGEVLAVERYPGDVVQAGDAAITIADRANLYIDALVDESDIARVAVGNPVIINLETIPDSSFNGTVSFINPVGESVSGLIKYKVRIEIDDNIEMILLGATADVTIQIGDARSALAVPATAIQSDKDGEYVNLILSNGGYKRVAVASGESIGELVVISGELKEGDRVQSEYQNGVQAPNPLGGN